MPSRRGSAWPVSCNVAWRVWALRACGRSAWLHQQDQAVEIGKSVLGDSGETIFHNCLHIEVEERGTFEMSDGDLRCSRQEWRRAQRRRISWVGQWCHRGSPEGSPDRLPRVETRPHSFGSNAPGPSSHVARRNCCQSTRKISKDQDANRRALGNCRRVRAPYRLLSRSSTTTVSVQKPRSPDPRFRVRDGVGRLCRAAPSPAVLDSLAGSFARDRVRPTRGDFWSSRQPCVLLVEKPVTATSPRSPQKSFDFRWRARPWISP